MLSRIGYAVGHCLPVWVPPCAILFGVLVLVRVLAGESALGRTADQTQRHNLAPRIALAINETRTISSNESIISTIVIDPNVVELRVSGERTVTLTGKAEGQTI